jgi:hypothetical protein
MIKFFLLLFEKEVSTRTKYEEKEIPDKLSATALIQQVTKT